MWRLPCWSGCERHSRHTHAERSARRGLPPLLTTLPALLACAAAPKHAGCKGLSLRAAVHPRAPSQRRRGCTVPGRARVLRLHPASCTLPHVVSQAVRRIGSELQAPKRGTTGGQCSAGTTGAGGWGCASYAARQAAGCARPLCPLTAGPATWPTCFGVRGWQHGRAGCQEGRRWATGRQQAGRGNCGHRCCAVAGTLRSPTHCCACLCPPPCLPSPRQRRQAVGRTAAHPLGGASQAGARHSRGARGAAHELPDTAAHVGAAGRDLGRLLGEAASGAGKLGVED